MSTFHKSVSHNQFMANVDDLFHKSSCESVNSDILEYDLHFLKSPLRSPKVKVYDIFYL